jgi:anti-sigma28 factor (negative regulator of flagellin synthesis)
MKRHDDSRDSFAAEMETERVFDGFNAVESEHSRREIEERVHKIARLKSEVSSGRYQADIKDIARLLTSAMDPML